MRAPAGRSCCARAAAISPCRYRRAFSARAARRHIPKGGSAAPTAGTTRARRRSRRRAAASCNRNCANGSSGPAGCAKSDPPSGHTSQVNAVRNGSDRAGADAPGSSNRLIRRSRIRSADRSRRRPSRRTRSSNRTFAKASASDAADAVGAEAIERAPHPRFRPARRNSSRRVRQRPSANKAAHLASRDHRIMRPPRRCARNQAKVVKGSARDATGVSGGADAGAVAVKAARRLHRRRPSDQMLASDTVDAAVGSGRLCVRRYRAEHSANPSQRMQ